MKTVALYYQDANIHQFEAKILRQEREGERWIAVLDRTAFYPEGGGQPADKGWLNGIPVQDVQKRGEEILHFLSEPLPEEGAVEGRIDPVWRSDFRQQHTGQHLMSASLLKTAGYQTVSVHHGEEYITIEIEAERIEESEILAAEDLANTIIEENRPVRTFWISRDEVDRYPFRRPPPKKERIRAVEIEGFDLAACGGVHLESTGKVGLIRTVGVETIRGRPRLQFKVGRRAYQDYREKHRLISRLSKELTCGMEEILDSVQNLKDSLTEQNRRIGELEGKLARYEADSLYERGRVIGSFRLIEKQFRDESSSLVSAIFKKLSKTGGALFCLTNITGGPEMQWLIGRSDDVPLSLKELVPPLLSLIEGKGGGSEVRWQGIGRRPEGAASFLRSLEEQFRRRLSKK